MKKTLILSLIIFTFAIACTTEDTVEQPKTATDETAADTLLDDQILTSAARANDLEGCDEILNQAKKTECIQIVNANLLTIKAVDAADKSLCGDIELERYREACESSVDEEIERQDEIIKKEESEEKRLEVEQSALDNNDASICDGIENDNDKYTCKFNVLANKAIEQNDPTICDKIGSEEFIKLCKENIPSSNT